MSFARQRSTPSTITTRWPSASVMLASAWAVRRGPPAPEQLEAAAVGL